MGRNRTGAIRRKFIDMSRRVERPAEATTESHDKKAAACRDGGVNCPELGRAHLLVEATAKVCDLRLWRGERVISGESQNS